ncbi:MAG: LPS assembly lipoprotein LptE [Verrucomicrobiota bacterium]
MSRRRKMTSGAWAPAWAALGVLILLSGCAGYRVGSIGGQEVQGLNAVYIPMAKNETYTPDVITYVTNETIRAFNNDGTLKTAQSSKADCELLITVTDIQRSQARTTREDVLTTAEYRLNITAEVTFINRVVGRRVIDNERITGTTTYFVQNDLNEAQRQALPLAAEDLSRNICLRVVEGW